MKSRRGGRSSNEAAPSTNRRSKPGNGAVAWSSAHSAAPSASKHGASSGTISPGTSRRRYSIIIAFCALPPTTMTSRRSTRLSSSRILSAIIRHSPAVTRARGTALVGGVRAVGLAEHGAAAGNRVGGLGGGEARGVLEAHVHAPQLLQEELAGARGALVAGRDVGDAPRAVQDVDHEGLPAGRDHGRAVHSRGLQEGIRPLHGLRLGDRCQVDELPEPAAGGCDAVDGGEVGLRQRPLQGALGVALMGVQRAADDPGARLRVAPVPLDLHQGDGRRSEAHS